jgi:hypothetical protein
MAAKANSKTQLNITEEPGVSKERRLADVALDPIAGAAAIGNIFTKPVFGETDLSETYVALSDRARDVRQNNLKSVEDMLTAQASALNAIFLQLAQRSHVNLGEYINAAERYMRLALKAQSQCRATLETLAAIKNPPVVYARQANIAAGHQQVNNGVDTPAREQKSKDLPNELLEAPSETTDGLDTRASRAPVGSNPELETVAPIDRTTNTARQGSVQPQCIQGRKAG